MIHFWQFGSKSILSLLGKTHKLCIKIVVYLVNDIIKNLPYIIYFLQAIYLKLKIHKLSPKYFIQNFILNLFCMKKNKNIEECMLLKNSMFK